LEITKAIAFKIPNISPRLMATNTAILNLNAYSFDPLLSAGKEKAKVDINTP
jgi:hypothetical protein